MKLWIAAFLLAFGCYLPSGAEDETEARLLVSKNILNLYLVEGKDLTVEYRIFNVGGSSALDTQLKDDSFPESDFEVVRGNLRADGQELLPWLQQFSGEGGIVPLKEFDRRFSPHVLDWLVFAIMTLPSLGIPFLLWFSSKTKYDTTKSRKGN